MSKKIIAVMAGTPVDTKMGVDFLLARDPSLTALSYPCAPNAREEHAFQLGPLEKRTSAVRAMVRDALSQGAQALLVYCNSLSGSLDFESLCREEGIALVTPLMVHRDLAAKSHRLGLIAANNQSLHGIEKVMFAGNPQCDVLGISLLPMVVAIEAKETPAAIVEKFGLAHALRFFEQNQVEQVALGCTHFPYLLEPLQALTSLPIFNPDDKMYEMLIG